MTTLKLLLFASTAVAFGTAAKDLFYWTWRRFGWPLLKSVWKMATAKASACTTAIAVAIVMHNGGNE